jgi:hypothetical protein
MAVKARDGGDEETADQLVLWASELFKEASREGSPAPGVGEQPLPDAAQSPNNAGKSRDLFH